MSLDDTTVDIRSIRGGAQPDLRSPYLFLVLECYRPLDGGARYSLRGVDEVRMGRGPARAVAREMDGRLLSVRVPDPSMSSSHARIVFAERRWLLIDEGSKNGTRLNGERIA